MVRFARRHKIAGVTRTINVRYIPQLITILKPHTEYSASIKDYAPVIFACQRGSVGSTSQSHFNINVISVSADGFCLGVLRDYLILSQARASKSKMILPPDSYGQGSSSISRQALLRGAASDGQSSASNRLANSVPLSPQAVAALVVACFVGAMLFGVAADAVVKYINQPIASDAPSERSSMERKTQTEIDQVARERMSPQEGLTRELGNFGEHSGDWTRRGVSITNGASSIGMSMYADIEDGCVEYRQHHLRHVDLSDPAKEPS